MCGRISGAVPEMVPGGATRPARVAAAATDPQPRASERRRYNRGALMTSSGSFARHPRRPVPMTTTTPTAGDGRPLPHGGQALHLRLGGGRRRGQRRDARPARRQGRRPGRDDDRRPARPRPGFTITTEACNDYFANGERLPDGPVGRRARGGQGGRAADRQGLRRPANPLLVSVRSGRQVLDARDDGHGPQPRPERGDAAGPHRAHEQRAVRLGRVPPVHPDVRAHRDGGQRRALRPRARRSQGERTAPSRTPTSTPRP